MAKIHQLPNSLINQIAAGEVIERPASVVKELIENAIDAGATEVEIEIEEAGSKLIRIKDNGCGIDKADLAMAFSTHATSKIRDFNDLESVMTLGFRGEALSSIASISKTTLLSKSIDEDNAWKISPYLNMDISPAAHPQGTTVEIRDLFYNTPARKKFLKSERTERHHIQQLLQRMALSNNELSIRLLQQGKTIVDYQGDTDISRISSILGHELLEQSAKIDAVNGNMRLTGWVGLPTFTSTQTDKQFFFINGRMIHDRIIVHAIKQAYQDILHHGKHPIFVLYLEIDPQLIDVNAHPAKHEVRFREARMTHDFIYSSLNHSLRAVRPQYKENTASFLPQNHSRQLNNNFNRPISNQPQPLRESSLRETQAYYDWMRKPAKQTNDIHPSIHSQNELIEKQADLSFDNHPLGYAIGQVQATFILAENNQGLVIVDMHAAHERILYEQLKSQLNHDQPASQQLLIPIALSMNIAQQELLAEHSSWIKQLGFDWQIAHQQVNLTAIPALLKNKDCEAIFVDLINELQVFPSSTKIQEVQNAILSTLCCHKAVRSHDKLSINEMNALLRAIENTPAAGQCNHGRPTWTQLDSKQLDQLFMRGQ